MARIESKRPHLSKALDALVERYKSEVARWVEDVARMYGKRRFWQLIAAKRAVMIMMDGAYRGITVDDGDAPVTWACPVPDPALHLRLVSTRRLDASLPTADATPLC